MGLGGAGGGLDAMMMQVGHVQLGQAMVYYQGSGDGSDLR